MKLWLIRILFICVTSASFGQNDQLQAPGNWWMDKPVTALDSQLLANAGYTTIRVYECSPDDSTDYKNPVYIRTLIGTWSLTYEQGRITYVSWNGKCHIDPVCRRKYKKKAIIDYIGYIRPGYRMTHLLDDSGHVMETKNKSLTKIRYESRLCFDRIDYVYKNGLLYQAGYYSSRYDPDMAPYLKYEFEYVK